MENRGKQEPARVTRFSSLRYTTLLAAVIGLLVGGQFLIIVSSYWLHSTTGEGLDRVVNRHQASLITLEEIQLDHLRARHLFRRNLLQPAIQPDELRRTFANLRTESRRADPDDGGIGERASQIYAGVIQYQRMVIEEGRDSDTPQQLANAVRNNLLRLDRQIDELMAGEVVADHPHTHSGIEQVHHMAMEATQLLERHLSTDPPHHAEIDQLLRRVETKLVNLGSAGLNVDYPDRLLHLVKTLRSGVHIVYGNQYDVRNDDVDGQLGVINQAFDQSDAMITLFRQALRRQIDDEQQQIVDAIDWREQLISYMNGLLLLFGGTGSWLLVNTIRRRVRLLAEGTQRIVRGEPEQRIELSSDDDLGKLARDFNQMVAHLAARDLRINSALEDLTRAKANLNLANLELEKRVEERTATLSETVEQLKQEVLRRSHAEKELQLASRVVENVQEGIVITDSHNRIISVNPAFTEITGFTEAEILGLDPGFSKSSRHGPEFYAEMWLQLLRDGHWRGEIWNRRKTGELFPKLLSISLLRDKGGEITNCVGVFSDITQQKQSEERLAQLAFYDPLTGLPNRSLFRERLERACASSERNDGRQFALFFVDLDHFKQVNDTLGHAAGDELLTEIGRRMRRAAKRDTDTIARMGGDEFTVILSPISADIDSSRVAEEIIAQVERPLMIKGQEVVIGCSIGIALYPEDGRDLEELTRNADVAMYHAKEKGRNNYQYYRSSLTQLSRERMELEQALRHALDDEEFTLYYQPKWSVMSGELVGFEALIRWRRGKGNDLVPPSLFVPLLEESRQIIDVGAWVVESAARQAKEWWEQYRRIIPVAVNVSARQMADPHFIDLFIVTLERYSLPAGAIEVEVTESSIMEDPKLAADLISGLHELQIPVAIDDFGTGYSSLGYLKQFKLHTLKVDRSFIRDITVDPDDEAIISAVISLADQLGMEVVLEGVERFEQLDRVMKLIGDNPRIYCQGFLLSQPVSPAQAARFIRNERLVDPVARLVTTDLAPHA